MGASVVLIFEGRQSAQNTLRPALRQVAPANEFTISLVMAKSISDIERNRKKTAGRGRPRTVTASVLVRLEADDVARLDAWIERQQKETGLKIGRGAAVRACMRLALMEK
jgi:hypothetical protein